MKLTKSKLYALMHAIKEPAQEFESHENLLHL